MACRQSWGKVPQFLAVLHAVDPDDRELVNDEWRLPRARELAQLVRALPLPHSTVTVSCV